jgi:two-component system chemotaxis response regulator CheY
LCGNDVKARDFRRPALANQPRTSDKQYWSRCKCDLLEEHMQATVMVVEDDAATRRLYRFLLTNSGYIVLEAEDGQAALEKLDAQACDVIITDMNMPRVGGIEMVRILRQTHPHIYVIMVTAFGTPDTEKQAIRAGVNEYLTKPFDFEELERRVSAYFARRTEKSPL